VRPPAPPALSWLEGLSEMSHSWGATQQANQNKHGETNSACVTCMCDSFDLQRVHCLSTITTLCSMNQHRGFGCRQRSLHTDASRQRCLSFQCLFDTCKSNPSRIHDAYWLPSDTNPEYKVREPAARNV
jgi:hypothetical protein